MKINRHETDGFWRGTGARITEVKTNALDDATADGRDKLLATAMVQQFEKTFPEWLTAAGTEVQIIETDGF